MLRAGPARRPRQHRAGDVNCAPPPPPLLPFAFPPPPLQRSAMEWEAPRLPRSPPSPSQLPALGELSSRYQLWGSTELFVRRSGRVFGSGLLPPASPLSSPPLGLPVSSFGLAKECGTIRGNKRKESSDAGVTLIPRRRQPPELRFPPWESFLTLSAFRLHRILNK